MATGLLVLVRVLVLVMGIGLPLTFRVLPAYASAAIPPSPGLEGKYTDQDEHWDGRYLLKRGELTVTAFLSSTRSPVQPYARQQPAILFTVPVGFRPGTSVTWEVKGWHMQTDGSPHPVRVEPHVFHVQIEPDGSARYVDDGQVDGVGYLRYEVRMAWPLAGAAPAVCARTESVQQAILLSLAETRPALEQNSAARKANPLCADVSWADLSTITTLGLGGGSALLDGVRSTDLAGLTELEALGLQVRDESLPEELLTQTPRLQTLQVKTGFVNWLPANFLAPVPHLENLTVESSFALAYPSFKQDLPPDFSSHAPPRAHLEFISDPGDLATPSFLLQLPELTQLTLKAWEMSDLPPAFLASVPELKQLDLDVWGITALPASFLAYAPRLQHLKLDATGITKLPDSFLVTSRELKHLALTVGDASALPVDFLDNNSKVEQLSLSIYRLDSLPVNFLSYLPNLRQLGLTFSGGMLTLPSGFLARTPQLEQVYLYAGSLTAFPEDFLAYAPHLRELTLYVRNLQEVRATLVQSMPNLTHLHLETQALEAYPVGFLDDLPQVVNLTLRADGLTRLPPRFLAHTPQLEKLTLSLHGVASWPQDSLAHTPQLQEMSLVANLLQTLPSGFLAYTPRLLKAALVLRQVKSLQKGFMRHTPRLQDLSVHAWSLESLPEGFLVYAPELVAMKLDTINAQFGGGHDGRLFRPGWHVGPNRWNFHLDEIHLATFPPGFLNNIPQLKTLEIWADVKKLPVGFLARAPQLAYLTLLTPVLEQLPEGFLGQVPRLDYLELITDIRKLPGDFLSNAPQLKTLRQRHGDHLDEIPANFLAQTPELSSVFLVIQGQPTMPRDFLSHSAKLASLYLYARELEVLPAGFLSHMPQLGLVDLDLPLLRVLPNNMLADVPMLYELYLTARHLETIPETFLQQAPRLSNLTIRSSALHSIPDHVWGHLWDHGKAMLVTGTLVNLRSGPGLQYDVIQTLEAGDPLYVQRRVNDPDAGTWLEVINPLELMGLRAWQGWIYAALTAPAPIGNAQPPPERPQ